MTLTLTTIGRCCAIFRGCEVEVILLVIASLFILGFIIGLADR